MNSYDAMLILPTSLNDESMDKAIDRVNEEIEKLGGKIETKDIVGKRTFARPMNKREAGVYVKLLVSLPADNVAPLLGRVKLIDDVFRMHVVRQAEKSLYKETKSTSEEKAAAPAAEASGGGRNG